MTSKLSATMQELPADYVPRQQQTKATRQL
jgi:hypothetical protein